jgi:GcrA cell cycle regulator
MTTPSTVATWNPERVEQLRHFVSAGLTCSQIAAEIGVTRNAVIGKIHRLGLGPGRPAAATGRACPPRVRRRPFSPQRQLLRLLEAQASVVADAAALGAVPIESTQRCSLLELAHGTCRWPLSDPGAADFAFCGNAAIAGFSYCAGHARMAYRPAGRRSA